MGLWEFLQQWSRGRIVLGIVASILLHVLLVVAGLWGLAPELAPRWKTKPGDSLIVELPKPEEVPTGPPSVSTPVPPPSAQRVNPPPGAPARREAAPPRRDAAPEPREQPRVAATARPSAPPPPAPRAPAPPRVVEPAPPGSEPTPRASEPTPRASEPVLPAAEPAPRAPAPGEPRRESGERAVAGLPPAGPPARPSLGDVRAALRGGAGGPSRDRGGIEGDPIPLDSSDARYSDYLAQVKRQIEEKWSAPCVRPGPGHPCAAHETSLDVQFGILKDGRVQFVDVTRVSVHSEYDHYAVRAILLAQPYPPVPAVMMKAMKAGSAGIPISARFVYIQPSLVKFLR